MQKRIKNPFMASTFAEWRRDEHFQPVIDWAMKKLADGERNSPVLISEWMNGPDGPYRSLLATIELQDGYPVIIKEIVNDLPWLE